MEKKWNASGCSWWKAEQWTIRRWRAEAARDRGRRDYLQWDRRCIKLTPTQHSNLQFCLHPILHTLRLHLNLQSFTLFYTPTPITHLTHALKNLLLHSPYPTYLLRTFQSNCYLWDSQSQFFFFFWYFNLRNPLQAGSSLTAENGINSTKMRLLLLNFCLKLRTTKCVTFDSIWLRLEHCFCNPSENVPMNYASALISDM